MIENDLQNDFELLVTMVMHELIENPLSSLMFNEQGRLAFVVHPKRDIMHLARHFHIIRTHDDRTLIADPEVLSAVLALGAIAFKTLSGQTQIDENEVFTAEFIPQGSEGADILSISEPDDRQLPLPGFGHGLGVPGGESVECAIVPFTRH